MACPRCKAAEVSGERCPRCGVVVAIYLAALEKMRQAPGPRAAAPPAPQTSATAPVAPVAAPSPPMRRL